MAAERGAKRNSTWGEWVGLQRLPRQRWLGSTRALQGGNRAHCCRGAVGKKEPELPLDRGRRPLSVP